MDPSGERATPARSPSSARVGTRAWGQVVTGVVLVVLGVLWLLDATGALDVRWRIAVPAMLVAVGVASIVLGSVVSRARDPASGVGPGLGLVAVGVAVLLDELDVWELRAALVLPLALIAVGVWFLVRTLVASRRGRAA